MSEPNLNMEAGRLEGFAMAIDKGAADSRKLATALREMAERLAGDRSQARAAMHARDEVSDDHRGPG